MELELVANVSLLFTEHEYLDRFAAAAAAGFQAVETWWPFPSADPSPGDVDRVVQASLASGIPIVGCNLFAGDMAAGDRGLLSRPDRQREFDAGLDVIEQVAARTGCRVFNALYGQRVPWLTAEEQDAAAQANLERATSRLGALGGTVLLEPLTAGSAGAYPLRTAADAVAVIERSRLAGLGLLFDTYHLANNGDDLIAVVDRHGPHIAHVQLADSPGRGEPGTGDLPLAAVLDRLWGAGYRRAVACEYSPSGPTAGTLGWVADMPHVSLR